MSGPAISVAMPARDAAPFLEQSIDSVLAQTFKDFELIVLVNGSSDESAAIARRRAERDRRLRVFEDPRPLGVVESSNVAISKGSAPLVARMDADDLCRRDRLERQLEVMRSADDVVAVGTLADGIDRHGRRVRPRDRWRLIRCAELPFAHGSAMFRRSVFERVGGYRQGAPLAQDVDLVLRLGEHGRILVLPDAMYTYRYHSGGWTLSATLCDVTRSKELLHRSFAARRGAGDDGDQVGSADDDPPRADVRVSALYYLGAMRLWAGERPAILREVIRSEAFTLSPAWLRTLVWSIWAEISPSTLRGALRSVVRLRDAVAATRIEDGVPVEWRPR